MRDAPALDQVTTGSLDALRKYAEASRAFDLTGDYTTAVQLLRESVKRMFEANKALASLRPTL